MEKFFRPNKLFVAFCLLLIIVWVTLQQVSTLRIAEIARQEAADIFTWNWPSEVSSGVEITGADVVKRSENEAVVKVQGRQKLAHGNGKKVEWPVECSAVLTLYRLNRNWVLGRVEFD